MKFPSVSPLWQLTGALVTLCTTLVLLGVMFFDVLPQPDLVQRQVRKTVADALAAQMAEALPREGRDGIESMLAAAVGRTPEAIGAGIRQFDGTLLVSSGPHAQAWGAGPRDADDLDHIAVPLLSGAGTWGWLELSFKPDPRASWQRWLDQPLVAMLAFIGVAGTLVFALYMRRALQHLDPSSVIPERVQSAFDVMAEGVVVVDLRGRVLLSNRAFRSLHPTLAQVAPGTALSSLAWITQALPSDTARHPWHEAIERSTANAGAMLEAGKGESPRHLVVNAAPVLDAGHHVRGCIVTFSDLTSLHQANTALNQAMAELAASKSQVERQNEELHRLATRDPLTGCLNRRAFLQTIKTQQAAEDPLPLALMVLDIDHFKSVNDTHGHGIGDRVIQEVAKQLQAVSRSSDLVCRWGGEEFCVALMGGDPATAEALAERVRAAIEQSVGPAVRECPGMRVTASLGLVVGALGAEQDVSIFVEQADGALYQAKRSGRNRVIRAADLVVGQDAALEAS